MLNPHGWKDYSYRMLYTDRFHFIHANVTSTTTACPRRQRSGRKAPAAPRSLGLGHRTRGCGSAPPKHGQGEVRGMWAGNASCTHAETKRKKKPTPKINGENGLCSILRKLPVSPCLQLGLAPLQQGQRACSRVAKAAGWRWEIRTLALLSFPCPLLCSSPAAPAFLALTPWHPSSRGPAGGTQRWQGARWPSAAPGGRVAERALPLAAPGWGCCLGRGPAGFGGPA